MRLERLLAARGDAVTGLIRNPIQEDDVRATGAMPVVADLEAIDAGALSFLLAGADAVVFAAGAGPGSGIPRKDTVDRAAAILLADAAERAGIRRYLLVSSMGVGAQPRPGRAGADEVFAAYLRAKTAAEEELRPRDLDLTVLRPGALTDEPGTGRVRLASWVPRGRVSRDDVAEVLRELLDTPASAGLTLELVAGDTPIPAAINATFS